MILFTVMIVMKTLHIQIIEGGKWRDKSVRVRVKDFEVMPNRGDICAVDGRKLATSLPYYALRFDASVVKTAVFEKNVDSLALCLSNFFKDASVAEYRKKLQYAKNNNKRYYPINKRKVSYNELKIVRQFPIFRLGRNKGGLIEEMSSVRKMPHEDLAVRTIGYVSGADDGSFEGRVGIEAAFENELRGIPGRSVRQMMSGTWIPITVEEPEDGCDVISTIDVDYQDIVQNALRRQLDKFEADNGTVILMEVKTGDIKAIANLTRRPSGDYKEQMNYAIGDAGEPGSVMKAATMIALLEDGYVDINDTVDLGGTGVYKFYDRTLSDSENKKPGLITVRKIFEVSSNGIAKIADEKYKTNPDRFINRLYGMGLDKKTGIRLKGEGQPYVKHPDEKGWTGITLPWMSIGYEILLTPLQVLSFYNAIANDGQRMRPRLVKEIRSKGEVVEEYDTEKVGGNICSRSTLTKIKDLLVGVVENGTAKNIRTDHYSIAGKTGTARIATGSSGYYKERKYRASFVGYFPADKPLYSCIVVVDNPSLSKGYYASQVSSPVFREIADKVYSIAYRQFGEVQEIKEKTIPVSKNGYKQDFRKIFRELDMDMDGLSDVKETDWVITASAEGENMVLKPRLINNSIVPNVKGMGLRDALYVLENAGLKVIVHGMGMVHKQSLIPGQNVREGSTITIEMKN
ncbi:transpeptidase family protein [Odoribacter sp. OttesenSCG-928-J03]|nr:transpeptidase family protein [Odoribacter sp. OttesenSCG-928-J03]MDL2331264.1 transpeptidase family protein [Odoribacter sp. OttesenSCG-928-A06]